jgi:alcohol dehydrogenase
MRTKAAVLRELGLPRPYTDSAPFSIEEVELADPGPHEVLVRIGAAGLCHSDLSVVDGSRPRPMPMVLGHEAAGTVEAVGSGVRDLAVGDRVVFSFIPMCGRCAPCLTGRPVLCEPGTVANLEGTLLGGVRRLADRAGAPIHHHLGVSAFAEHAVCSDASLVKIGPELPFAEAALLGCALLTGVGAVVNTAHAGPGTSAAVFGLGGVGLSVVMGAAMAGCHPIVAVDMVADKLERARRLGATHTVAAGADAVGEVVELTAGGAEFAFEAVGSAAVLAQAYAATRRGGTTVTVGLPAPEQMLSISAISLVAHERRLLGSFMGSSVPQRDIPRLIALRRAGALDLDALTTGHIGLDEINAGFEALASGEAVRQVVVFGDAAAGPA